MIVEKTRPLPLTNEELKRLSAKYPPPLEWWDEPSPFVECEIMEDRLSELKNAATKFCIQNHGQERVGALIHWAVMEIQRLREEAEVSKRSIQTWEKLYGCGPVATS